MQTSSQDYALSSIAVTTKLPPEVLVTLLEKLDQQQLGIASVVCTSWRHAALTALKQLTLVIKNITEASLLPYWLRSRVQHLQHLELQYCSSLYVQPFGSATEQLCSLEINRGALTGSVSGTLTSLQGLTSLALRFVTADEQLLSSIAALTKLHSLHLETVDWGPLITSANRKRLSKAASSIWSNLLQLTSLSVTACDLDDQAVHHITCLTSLQQLNLSGNQIRDARVLLPIPRSLTHLSLDYNHEEFECDTLFGPQCPQQLEHLSIVGLSMLDTSQLSSLANLTRLEACELHTPDNEQLLAVLPQLQHLQHLDVRGTYGFYNHSAIIQHLNAALQLPQLTYLDFGYNGLIAQPWEGPLNQTPPNPVLFSNSNIPKLQVLLLDCFEAPAEVGPNCYYREEEFEVLVAKCPKLQQLDVMGRIHEDSGPEELQPLQQLSCLTSLSIGGTAAGDAAEEGFAIDDDVLRLLAKLTTLEKLLVHASEEVTDLGLMSLTKLTRLTRLEVFALDEAHEVSPQLMPPGPGYSITITATNKDPKHPNVWQQLSSLCAKSPVCIAQRHKELEKELKAAKKEVAAERKRTAAARKEAAAAQREVAALRQQLAELQAAPSSQNTG